MGHTSRIERARVGCAEELPKELTRSLRVYERPGPVAGGTDSSSVCMRRVLVAGVRCVRAYGVCVRRVRTAYAFGGFERAACACGVCV